MSFDNRDPTSAPSPQSSSGEENVAKPPDPGQVLGFLLRGPFVSLVYRNFRLLWLGQLSQAGAMWTEQVVRNWLTLELTGSAFQVGAVNFTRAIPSLVLGMWGGVLADRFDKRLLLMIIQAWSLLVYITMAWVVLSDNLQLWHLYASGTALSFGMAINQPVRTSLVPSLVSRAYLLSALSLNSVAINAARLVGPLLVGVLIATANPGWAYVITAVFYVLISIFTFMMHVPPVAVRERATTMAQDLAEGLRYVTRERTILALLIMPIGPLAIAFSWQALLPVFAVRSLGMDAGGYGAMLSIAGVGALLGGLTIASKGRMPRQGLIAFGAGISYGVALLALSQAQWLVLAIPFLLMAGGSQTVFRAANNSMLLANAPAHMRGRITSLAGLTQGISPVIMLAAGAVADMYGVDVAMAAIGVGCLMVVVSVSLWEPQLRKL